MQEARPCLTERLLMGCKESNQIKPLSIFQLNRDGSSWVELVLSQDKFVLLKDHNAVTQVRLEPAAPLSQTKHFTTEPLCSLLYSTGSTQEDHPTITEKIVDCDVKNQMT